VDAQKKNKIIIGPAREEKNLDQFKKKGVEIVQSQKTDRQ